MANKNTKPAPEAGKQPGASSAGTDQQTPPAPDPPTPDSPAPDPPATAPTPPLKPPPPPPPAAESKPLEVRVITKGPLGPRLLMPGEITSDPAYVALLKVKGQKKVEAVK